MQQTQNLKLNLIETSDPLSPAPLNENAQKLDSGITCLDAAQTSLSQRVAVLEARHFMVGSYVGDGEQAQEIDLGFTPKGVLVQGNCNHYDVILALEDSVGMEHYGTVIQIIPNGFRARNNGHVHQTQKNKIFYFVAFD